MTFNLTTFVFEIINFGVLLFLLQRIVFKPLRKGIDARRLELASRQAKLLASETTVDSRSKALDARAEELDRLRLDALREATEAAAAERARILEQAREDAAADRQRAQKLLEAEREAAVAEVRELAIEKSTDLAGRLLMQLAPGSMDGLLVDLVVADLAQRGPSLKALAAGVSPVEVELDWAHMPPDADRARLKAALELALGGPVRTTHTEDAALLAGVRLRLCNRLLDASVAGQLDLVRDRVRALVSEDEANA